MTKPLIAGNWKMHMTRRQALGLLDDLKERLKGRSLPCDVAVAPPFTALHVVSDALGSTPWSLAAQNVHWEDQGAYTGEISPVMLAELGCRFVIVGHSERRQLFGETDDMIRRKIAAVLRHSMTPILCVGETLEQRERQETFSVVQSQLSGALDGVDPQGSEIVIAYEPVWAIGTGRTATPDQAQEVHSAIRDWLSRRLSPESAQRTRILYGGSVNPSNIDELMAQPDIDGALVGGASLKAESFSRIVEFRPPDR
jgi:triosephosphate isomerase